MAHLEAALAVNKAVIFAGYHHGLFWMLPAAIHFKLAVKLNVLLGTNLEHADVSSEHVRFFPQNTENVAKIGRLLLEGDQNLLLFPDAVFRYKDQDAGQLIYRGRWSKQDTELITFFGKQVAGNSGACWFHQTAKIPILPVMLLWRRNRTAKLVIGEPVSDLKYVKPKPGSRKKYSSMITHKIYDQLENWIRDFPEQWISLTKEIK